MPSEALLLGIATIAVVVAGFTGVTSTLVPSGGSWPPRCASASGRSCPPASTSCSSHSRRLGDARMAIVVASAGVADYATGIVIWRGRQLLRAGGTRTRTAVVLYALGLTATLLFWANALVLGSLAAYALALCVRLTVAVVSFYSLVAAAQG